MPLVQTQKNAVNGIKVAKKHHYSATLRWPPDCRSPAQPMSIQRRREAHRFDWPPRVDRAPVGRQRLSPLVCPRGPQRFVRSRRPASCPRSARVGGDSRARVLRSQPAVGIDAPPRLPPKPQRVDWIDCTRAAPGYQSSHQRAAQE